MASLNQVFLIGNLTRDPQTRFLTSGTAICEFDLAVSRKWKDQKTGQQQEEVTFVNVVCWGRTAEIAGEYLAKGRPVMIQGRLTLDQWEDKETKQKRSRLKVTCEDLQMLGNKGSGNANGGGESSGQTSHSEPSGESQPQTEEVPF